MKTFVLCVVFAISLCFLPTMQTTAFAGCWVEDGTFYSSSKYDMTTFAIAMYQGNRAKALQMVDERRIHTSTQASSVVLIRESPLVYLNIMGIGKVWIYETFLQCK